MASWEEQERESRELAALELQCDVAKGLNRIADALEAIAAAIHRHADVHLYVNDPDAEDAPAEAGSLPDGFRGMR